MAGRFYIKLSILTGWFNMNKLDLKLKMLSNCPIVIKGISIHHVSIKQISAFGYEKYNQGIKILCISKSEIESLINEKISPFEFLRINMMFDPNVKTLLAEILSLICRAGVVFSEKQKAFIIGKELLDKNNFDEIISVIRERNSIENNDNTDENPSNEKARMILQKRKNARNRLMKNSVNDNVLHLPNLVSIVATAMKIPINKVMEYSIYQLTDQFKRLMSKEGYETGINALIHGASKSDLDLKHWTER